MLVPPSIPMSSSGIFASLAALMLNCVKKDIDYSPCEEGEWSTMVAPQMDIYHSMGDALAQQYGGYAAHNTGIAEMEKLMYTTFLMLTAD
ncbi:hypothetical protein ACFX2I_024835 [Malus domestica]